LMRDSISLAAISSPEKTNETLRRNKRQKTEGRKQKADGRSGEQTGAIRLIVKEISRG